VAAVSLRFKIAKQPHAKYRHRNTAAYPVRVSLEIDPAAGQQKAG
jgi:hypothetical protein